MNEHILVVDDDPKVRSVLRKCFELENYRVTEAGSGQIALDTIASDPVDLITLDLTLGDEDGLMIAREVRSNSNVPIIMVTGKGDTIDRVVGLELGADDYITKPFHLREVLARVRTVLRRASGDAARPSDTACAPATNSKTFGDWNFNVDKRELTFNDGNECILTTSEFDLLRLFVERPNRVLSRDQIMDLLKGCEWSPTDRTIDNQIARLRKKIERDPTQPKLIKTVRGVGYSFTADVT